MIRTLQNSLSATQVPAQELTEIGLRATAGLTSVACDAGNRLNALQLAALRSAVNDCARVASQFLAAEPLASVDPAIDAVRRAVSYWRSLAGLAATSQAEGANVMETTLKDLVELMETTAAKNSETGMAAVPLAFYAAAGTSALASAEALCNQFSHSVRQFAMESGIERDLAARTGGDIEQSEHQARTHRKAA
jgi:hypothetical protein